MPSSPTLECSQGEELQKACSLGSTESLFEGGRRLSRPKTQHLSRNQSSRGKTSRSCSVTSLVDDVAAKFVANTSEQLSDRSAQFAACLDMHFGTTGVEQNLDKRVHSGIFHGMGSRQGMKEQYCESGGAGRDARYLGPWLRYDGSFVGERARRVAAARGAWRAFSKFFTSGAILRLRVLAFRCVVVMTLFPGVLSFVLSPADEAVFDSFIAARGRTLLKGKACEREEGEGETRYRALSSREVMRTLGIAPTAIELAVQRLRWFQSVLMEPAHHEMYLTAMFGQFAFETQPLVHQKGGDNHPWVWQLCKDLSRLSQLDSCACFVERMQRCPLIS